jgi:hypothetical protein
VDQLPASIREAVRAKRYRRLTAAQGHVAATAIILPLDMTNHLALIKNARRHEYRRRLIATEKSWRDAQVAILFGKASRKAAFATNDSGRYWRRSGASQSGRSSSGVLAITRGPESKMSAAGAQSGRAPSRAQLAPAQIAPSRP